jgi:hypothetical protein
VVSLTVTDMVERVLVSELLGGSSENEELTDTSEEVDNSAAVVAGSNRSFVVASGSLGVVKVVGKVGGSQVVETSSGTVRCDSPAVVVAAMVGWLGISSVTSVVVASIVPAAVVPAGEVDRSSENVDAAVDASGESHDAVAISKVVVTAGSAGVVAATAVVPCEVVA